MIPSERLGDGARTKFHGLPLFAQALVAARIARRAVLATINNEHDRALALAVCDALDAACRRGDGWKSAEAAHERAGAIASNRQTSSTIECLRMAVDSCGAAQASLDFPIDAPVAASAERAIEAIARDARIGPIQIHIAFAADVDLLAFACEEARINKYDGLAPTPRPPHPAVDATQRLASVHAFTLTEPSRSPEERMR